MHPSAWLAIARLFSLGGCIHLTRHQELPPENSGPAAGKAAEIAWGSNASHVEVQLTYPTTGWVAMGLSSNGGMDQSDVLFGYVDAITHEVVVQDRWSTYEGNLEMDKQQDWQMVSGSNNGTYTVLRAVRKIKTCDDKDRPFGNQASPVIYSYSFQQPTSKTSTVRKHDVHGSVSIKFLHEKDKSQLLKDVNKVLEFRVNNVHVSSDKTTQHYCTLLQMPVLKKKYHSIAVGTKYNIRIFERKFLRDIGVTNISEHEPLINRYNLPHVHHMVVYTCDGIPKEQLAPKAFPCGPGDGTFMMQFCKGLLSGWAVGGEPIVYEPNDAGMSFTPDMSGKYVVIQMHYNNPDLAEFDDDSGLRIMLTDKLRKYDSASLMVGAYQFDFAFTLPPEQKVFQMQAQCSDQCTSPAIPKEGIKIFSSLIHMHSRGVSGAVRHFREKKELPPLDMDRAYDFNLQAWREIDPPRVVLPGDRLVLQCNFTTANDSEPVFGGEGSREEMCLAFLSYYPKTSLHICGASFPVKKYLTSGLQMDRNAITSLVSALSPEARQVLLQTITGASIHGMKEQNMMAQLKDGVSKYINAVHWTPQRAQLLEDFYFARDNYIGVCIMDNGTKVIQNDNPPPIRPYVLPALKAEC